MLGRVPFAPFRSAYSAAKHALNALTANLRMELRATHPAIHVSMVHPGVVATDFGNNALHGGVDSRKLPGAQPAEEVAAGHRGRHRAAARRRVHAARRAADRCRLLRRRGHGRGRRSFGPPRTFDPGSRLGVHAELRVVERAIAAGAREELRVRAALDDHTRSSTRI